jgi:hypothetical protein
LEWLLLLPLTAAAVLLYVLFKPSVHPDHLEFVKEAEVRPVPIMTEENAPAVATVHSAPVLVNHTGRE